MSEMKFIAVYLVFLFGTLQAFDDYDTPEEFDDILGDMTDSLSSEEESEINGVVSDTYDDSDEENLKDNSDVLNSVDEKLDNRVEEQGNVYWSYVLWRPSVLDDSGLQESQKNYYKSLDYIQNFFNGGFKDNMNEEKDEQGWKDDFKQLDLPRVSALTSNSEPDFYDNVAESFTNLKETMNDVVSRPEVKDNMFYIIMGLTGFLLLVFLNDNLFNKQKPRNAQNHYLLPDTGASAKLPTYDECMKAEKNIHVIIGENEVFNKVDLSLPVFAVDKEKGERNNK